MAWFALHTPLTRAAKCLSDGPRLARLELELEEGRAAQLALEEAMLELMRKTGEQEKAYLAAISAGEDREKKVAESLRLAQERMRLMEVETQAAAARDIDMKVTAGSDGESRSFSDNYLYNIYIYIYTFAATQHTATAFARHISHAYHGQRTSSVSSYMFLCNPLLVGMCFLYNFLIFWYR
jgi:hypothetical protein